MNKCNHCLEVNTEVEIKSPRDFDKALKVIRGNLEDGTIIESDYWPEGQLRICSTPFSEIKTKGPYQEDIFIYYFECPECRKLFNLGCNTYHGSGGKWKPLNEFNI